MIYKILTVLMLLLLILNLSGKLNTDISNWNIIFIWMGLVVFIYITSMLLGFIVIVYTLIGIVDKYKDNL